MSTLYQKPRPLNKTSPKFLANVVRRKAITVVRLKANYMQACRNLKAAKEALRLRKAR